MVILLHPVLKEGEAVRQDQVAYPQRAPENVLANSSGRPPPDPGGGRIRRGRGALREEEAMEVSNDGPPPPDNPPQHFLDLSNVGTQIAAAGALFTGAILSGAQSVIVPALEAQGAQIANHMVEAIAQRAAQFIPQYEAVAAMEGVEIAAEGAAAVGVAGSQQPPSSQ